MENLNANDLKSLRREAFPQDSGDRLWVFLVEFVVSGTVVVAPSLIAWTAAAAAAALTSTVNGTPGIAVNTSCRVAMRWCASRNWARVGLVGG